MVFHILKTAFCKIKIEFLFFIRRLSISSLLQTSMDIILRNISQCCLNYVHFFWYRQVFQILKLDGKAEHLTSTDTCCTLFVWGLWVSDTGEQWIKQQDVCPCSVLHTLLAWYENLKWRRPTQHLVTGSISPLKFTSGQQHKKADFP
jgi:hypothetical protein